MNHEARAYVAEAKEYLAKGDENYGKAAESMRAARDAGATWPEIADGLGRSESWCQKIVAWAKNPANDLSSSTPWENHQDINQRKARQVLREAPLDLLKKTIDSLPRDRRREVLEVVEESLADDAPLRHLSKPNSEPSRSHSYVIAEGQLARANRFLRKFIDTVRKYEWDGEEAELLEDTIANARQLIELAALAVAGSTGVDWDAELENLTGGGTR